MLQNNLDPEVAERPQDLVVYGGIGRAARDWASFDEILATLKRARTTTRRCWCSRASRWACSRRTTNAPRVLIANSNLVPQVGDLGPLQRARPQGPDDVRPDDRGLLDLHRQPGHRAGHLRDLRRGRPPALQRRPRGQVDPHRRPRRHGRRAAAGRHDGRRCHRSPSNASSRASTCACARATSTSRPATSTTRSRSSGSTRRRRRRCRSACSATRPRSCPSSSAQGGGIQPDLVTDQTSAHDLVERLPAGRLDASSSGKPRRQTTQHPKRSKAAAQVLRRARAGHARLPAPWASRPSTTATTSARSRIDEGVADAFDFPGFVPAYIRPLFCEGKGPFRWVALSGDPGGHLQDRRQGQGAVPRRTRTCTAGSTWRASASSSRACPRASAGWAWASATRPALAFNEMVASGELKAPDRDRPRPPRYRLGREPQPRDRSDEGRLATPSPTGRCSTRCSTPRAARRGYRSTTAAASAWATRSTPAW